MYAATEAPVRLAIAGSRFPRVEKGNGEPVVFLHGIFGSPENWRDQMDALACRYRVVVPILPIFEVPLGECSVDTFTDHVRKYLDWAGMDRATFVGNSFGGHIALDLAIRFPECVRALVLAGSSGLFERGYEKGVPVRPSREWITDRIAAQVFHDASQIRPEMVEEVVETLASSANRRRLVRLAKSAKRTHMGNKLHCISAPTLLIWGKQDQITPLDVAREFMEGIPDAELVLIDQCGHAPMIEQPSRFTTALSSFLDSLSNGRAA